MSHSAADSGLTKVMIALYDPELESTLAQQSPEGELLHPTAREHAWLNLQQVARAASPLQALQLARSAGARCVLLLAADQSVPKGLLHRLLLAMDARPDGVISPLCVDQLTTCGDTASFAHVGQAVLDRWAWVVGDRTALAGQGFNPAASLWCEDALESLSRPLDGFGIPFGIDSRWIPYAVVGDHEHTATAPNAAALQLAGSLRELDTSLDQHPPALFGLDACKVLLHVLHGWGGGSERFVRDLMAAGQDQQTAHLVLRAEADPQAHLTARALCLHHDLTQPPLRRWVLSNPIAVTALHCGDVQDLLQTVCAEFSVSAVLVSSVIGHSLDVLRTGLPTNVVCHDYFPLWPQLHADFGSNDFDGSDSALEVLVGKGSVAPFQAQPVDYWRYLRQQYLAAVAEADATLFAPTHSVRANLCRLANALTDCHWRVQAHGLPPWPQQPGDNTPPPRDRLRVLVPGRINGGKGEDLLAQLLSEPLPGIEWILLGCGHAGMRFFGTDHVHVVLNYELQTLPEKLAELKPDLAFLPATVAETFGYSLSEMWSLRVPVLATRIGSYSERIRDGIDGLLIEPNAAKARKALLRLRDRSDLLLRLRSSAPHQRSIAEAHAMYLGAFHEAPAVEARRCNLLTARVLLHLREARQLHTLQREVTKLHSQIEAQQAELDRRGVWGNWLDKELRTTRLEHMKEQIRNTEKMHALENDKRDTEASLRDTEASLRDTEVSLRDTEASLRDTEASLRDTEASLRDTEASLGETEASLRDTLVSLRYAEATLSNTEASKREIEQLLQGVNQALISSRAELAGIQHILREELDGRLHEVDGQHFLSQQIRHRMLELHAERMHFEEARNAILHSSSWRLTRPLRGVRRMIDGLLSRLHFRQQRLLSVLHRSLRSLKTRGLKGTLQRARREFSPAQPRIEMQIPAAAAFMSFELPCPEQPMVSVIIPAYNHLNHTLTCLRSIAAQPSMVSAEIIVVDDCSSDETEVTLPQIGGLRYLRNAQNLGFIGACNAGADAARGDYLLFLNNDTAVQPGWLDALMETFTTHANVGLVGAKLIYPDGRLQEAGGIVFADASGWNYGRFGDPSAPEYNFVREADYCSGAAIAVPTALFREFDGFDRHYAPAYYEDTDLAMKVWDKGLRVLYQPAAAVVHFEGISSGTDTTTGVKAYQVVNQQKFLERWQARLQRHPVAGTRIELARQHRDGRRVLIIDATTPTPDQDSGSLRMLNLMKVLRAEGYAISFFADNRAWLPRYTAELQQLGVEVLWHPYLSDPVRWFAEQGPLLDAVILSRHYIASQYVDLVRQHAPKATLVFDTVDLHYLREQREAALANREDLHKQAAVTREKELDLMRRCDVTLVVSPVEQALLASDVPEARVEVLSNVHEVFGRRAEFAERTDLMFVGGYQHPPNVDAVQWFANDVLPLIRAQEPNIRFHIIGSKAPESIAKLGEQDGIVFHGFVENIEPLLDRIRIAVAPLRWGAGVKGKVNMSMSYGQPVVATPIAVEGMYAEPERDVLVADSAEAFASAVLRLYHDEALWQQLSANGLQNVQSHFSFDAARASLRRVLMH